MKKSVTLDLRLRAEKTGADEEDLIVADKEGLGVSLVALDTETAV